MLLGFWVEKENFQKQCVSVKELLYASISMRPVSYQIKVGD
jgi:hypothetical protein